MTTASADNFAPGFALFGAISGVISGPLVMIGGPFIGAIAETLVLSFVGFAPGLVFGLMVGGLLYRQEMIDGRVYQVYIAAAAGSCWVATRVTYLLLFDGDEWNPQWGLGAALHHYVPDAFQTNALAGAVGGLIGAGLLTAVTLVVVPCTRRVLSGVSMVAAGGLLGLLVGLIFKSGELLAFIYFYGVWQSGYAACLGAALRPKAETTR